MQTAPLGVSYSVRGANVRVVAHIEVRDGNAYVAGRNIKAKLVARMHLWERRSIEDVMAQYDLTPSEVHAAVAFYYDNRAELDAEYEDHMRLLRRVGTPVDAFKSEIDSRKKRD